MSLVDTDLVDTDLVGASGAATLIEPYGLFFPLSLLLVAVARRRLAPPWVVPPWVAVLVNVAPGDRLRRRLPGHLRLHPAGRGRRAGLNSVAPV